MSNSIMPSIQAAMSEKRRAISSGDMSAPPSSTRSIATRASTSRFQSHEHFRISSRRVLGSSCHQSPS
jgi:hypothetical protein